MRMMRKTATVVIAATLGTGAAIGVAACGEDRRARCSSRAGTGTEATGTGTETTGETTPETTGTTTSP